MAKAADRGRLRQDRYRFAAPGRLLGAPRSRFTLAIIAKLSRLMSVIAIAASVLFAVSMATESPAYATTCTTQQYWYYAGEHTLDLHAGIGRYISVDGISMWDQGQYGHLLNYLNVQYDSNHWLQVGYGMGSAGSGYSSNLEAYVEGSDVNGYDFGYYPNIPLAQNDFYTLYYTGTSNGGNFLWDGWINNGSNWILIGQSWVPDVAATAYAQTEAAVFLNQPCPVLNPYEWFGTYGNGAADANTGLELDDGGNWALWDPGNFPYETPQLQVNAPYNFVWLDSWYAFYTWGS